MSKVLAGVLALAILAPAAASADTVKQLSLRVGGSATIGTFGQHTKSCDTLGGAIVQITKAPTLGEIATTELQPYIAKTSISGTCLGHKFLGTRVDYRAKSAGKDSFEVDLVFKNGVVHYSVTTTNH